MTRATPSVPQWASLPTGLSRKTIEKLNSGLQGWFVGLAERAGIRFRLPSSGPPRLQAGGSYPTFFRLIPLQDAAGELLPDADKRLSNDRDVLGFGEAIAEHSQTQPVETTLMGESELEIMSEPDTVAALKRLQGKVEGHLTFFLLRSTDALVSRLLVWPVLAQLSKGTPPEEVIATLRNTDDRRTAGLVQVIPASFICYPLLARSQPLAAVFTTAYGSQVVAVLRDG